MIATAPDAKTRLLDAAMDILRAKGYAATTVDELCRAAGVTKGAFFHHFRSKEDLAVAAAAHFGEMAEGLFSAAPYRALAHPVERLLAYVDFRKSILQGEIPDWTCLLGTMVQEAYATSPAIREACEREIIGHAATLEADFAEAQALTGRAAGLTPASLARHTQAVLQGAFVLGKATGGSAAAADSLDHLRHYLELLFDHQPSKEDTP